MSGNVNTLEIPVDLRELEETQILTPTRDRRLILYQPFGFFTAIPSDVRTILSLASTGMLLVLLLLISVGLNFYQYVRRPDRIVVDRSSGRVLEINDRDYGETEAVQLGPDRLTNADKQYITGEFVRALYQVDPATRPRDIERALRMMVPDSALKFARYLKQEGTLEKQRAESWQAVWTPQDISVDRVDPYTVRVIGKQEITKLVAGAVEHEMRQLNLTLKLAADPERRADRNLRSGFLIAAFDYKELKPDSGRVSPEPRQ